MRKNAQQSTFNAQRSTLCVRRWAFISAYLMLLQFSSPLLLLADTHYVDINCATPTPPYTNWAAAATVIQDSIDAASEGDTVLVADGVYASGGRAVYGTMTNRIAITKSITVTSLNGPNAAQIVGRGPMGDGAIRCAYVTDNAVLAGFALINGATRISGDLYSDRSGGGVWCAGGIVSNCIVTGNQADQNGGGSYRGTLVNCQLKGNLSSSGGGGCETVFEKCLLSENRATIYGGGAFRGTLYRCLISENTSSREGGGAMEGDLKSCVIIDNFAVYGGGACYGNLYNCTIVGNSAMAEGGGAFWGSLTNCIVYYNKALVGSNFLGSTLINCCTTPTPDGTGNITENPSLISTAHIAPNSPCLGKGLLLNASVVDIDGDSWLVPPSIGADEPTVVSSTGTLTVAIQASYRMVKVGFGAQFRAIIDGQVTQSQWDFGDGLKLTNSLYATHTWSTTGTFPVVLTAWNLENMNGVSYTALVSVAEDLVYYVNASNKGPVYPYTSWTTAATNIQDALSADGAPGGRLILVNDGVYQVGGITMFGTMTNRVALFNAVTMRSVSGPERTIISGGMMAMVRCAYVGNDCVLEGFTLRNGTTQWSGDESRECAGGGVWCEPGGLVKQCVIKSNMASFAGGGCFGGTLVNCTVMSNTCNFGFGGGAYLSQVRSSLFLGNYAYLGGGASKCNIYNSTIVGNRAYPHNPGNNMAFGGGAYESVINNSIIYYNTAYNGSNCVYSLVSYCCTTPTGYGNNNNITAPPAFVNRIIGDYRLSAGSPCIDAGINQAWMFSATDLLGKVRVRNGVVDLGAFEAVYTAQMRATLEGAYCSNGVGMAVSLAGKMPIVSPYKATQAVVEKTPSNMVDWVLVEVQDTNRNVLVSMSVFLDQQGWVTDVSGSATIPVEVSAGNYYLVLRHRNHLAAMSAMPVPFSSTVVSYDFTTGPEKYFGGTNACVELDPGVWGLIAGDADGDGRITPVDREIVRRQQGMTGYLQGDLNLDGKVDGGDE